MTFQISPGVYTEEPVIKTELLETPYSALYEFVFSTIQTIKNTPIPYWTFDSSSVTFDSNTATFDGFN